MAGMYWRREGSVSEEKEFVKLVIRFENRYVRSERCEPLSLFGSSTSICCISCRRLSTESLSKPSSDGRSRLERADSTVGGAYRLADEEAWRLECRNNPCLSASSLISSGPTRDWRELGCDDVASSYVGMGSVSYLFLSFSSMLDGCRRLAPAGLQE